LKSTELAGIKKQQKQHTHKEKTRKKHKSNDSWLFTCNDKFLKISANLQATLAPEAHPAE
jgi:hypothetical protein